MAYYKGRVAVDPLIRFHKNYIINQDTNCWDWQGTKDRCGYGRMSIKKRYISAHRFSYETFNGHLINGLVIAHNCNNPSCVNPEHLRQDTMRSNMLDMTYIKSHPKQILSVDEVIQIKKELKFPYYGQQKDLAHFYKVSTATISEIKTGRKWSHISIP